MKQKKEKDDYLIPIEKSELVKDALQNYISVYGRSFQELANELCISKVLLRGILDFEPSDAGVNSGNHNVVSIEKFKQ